MIRNRYHRTLALALLVACLVVLPVTVDAAPRDGGRDAGAFDLLVSTWDWISNLWGAGGGNWDPGRTPTVGPASIATQGPGAATAEISAPVRADLRPDDLAGSLGRRAAER